jgi:hypothetical protein
MTQSDTVTWILVMYIAEYQHNNFIYVHIIKINMLQCVVFVFVWGNRSSDYCIVNDRKNKIHSDR